MLLQNTLSGVGGQPPMHRALFSQPGQAPRILSWKRLNGSLFQASAIDACSSNCTRQKSPEVSYHISNISTESKGI